MILVVDSGSYKSDWMLALPDSPPLKFQSRGLNPLFTTEKEILSTLQNIQEIIPYTNLITEVYFFGSGCTNPDRRELVSNVLSHIFPKAFIAVETDLIGSAYATCGNNKGYIAVLGTGSNISFFDGANVRPSRHEVGFILGDEGSGVWFGKKLVTNYLYGTMPAELIRSFRESYPIDREIVIKNVYQRATPNTYLASFAPFLSKHREHVYINKLIADGFDEFVQSNVLVYPEHKEYICHFVGSIAFYFQKELRLACLKNGIQAGKIIQQSIEELFKFVVERELNYEIE